MLHSRHGIALAAAVAAVAVLAAVVGIFVLLPARSIVVVVVDAATGQPLAGAAVILDGREITSDTDGSFSLAGGRFGSPIVARARGYVPASAAVLLDGRVELALSPRILNGAIADAATGKLVSGAQLTSGSLSAMSDGQGSFRLVGIEPGTQVVVAAPGYMRLTLDYDRQPTADLKLQPTVVTLTVLNQYTGQPVQGVEIGDGKSIAIADQHGQATLRYLQQGADITGKLDGFAPVKLAYSGQDSLDVGLRPDVVAGTVKDATGKPLAKAIVTDGKTAGTTDDRGAFRLSGIQENGKLIVTSAGYERKQVEVGHNTIVDVTLKPFAAKAAYLTFYGVGDEELRGHVLELAGKTEINAVVIDIKGDRGWITYKSDVPMVKVIGAQQEITIPDPRKLLADLKRRGVYTIARIVVFKDNPLATARPDLAVTNSATGRPWVDGEGLRWADPTRQEVWDYDIALAVEAIHNGFDEVQFDYVRFPTDASAGNSLDSVRFSQDNSPANRVAAINGFLERAKQAIHAAGGLVSADVFGYVVWRTDDLGIGQNLEELAKHLDYVSPMIYPNLFWDGIEVDGVLKYGGQKSGLYPYEVVHESMKVAVKRIGAEKLRPWLQYYNDYVTDKSYGPAEMNAQKKATYDTGVKGWLFWDPTNRFSKGGFDPE